MRSSKRRRNFSHQTTPWTAGVELVFELLPSLLILVVISVLLLGQEDPEVGLAP